jgi:hypothetical protein
LTGRLVVALAPLRLDVARALVPAPLRLLPAWPARALAMLVVGLYGEGSTLRYSEVVDVVGPVLAGGRLGAWSPRSGSTTSARWPGGREVWGLPKQLATLRWRPGAVEVPRSCTRAGANRMHMPVPAAAPFIAVLDGAARHAWLAGSLQLAPTVIGARHPRRLAARLPRAHRTPPRAHRTARRASHRPARRPHHLTGLGLDSAAPTPPPHNNSPVCRAYGR